MDNVWQANVSGTAPTPVTPTAGYPTETGTPTIPGAYWFHMITQELLAVITGAGITPAYGVLNQVDTAINSLISTAVSSAVSGLSSTYATKTYAGATFAALGGATFTGPVVLAADPTVALGAATKQYVDKSLLPCKAAVYKSMATSIANNTITFVSFDTVRDDTNLGTSNVFWSSSTPTRLTVTTPGAYLVHATIEFAANATGVRDIGIRVNGSLYISSMRVGAPSSSDTADVECHRVWQFNTGDYVELSVRQTSGGALNLNSTGDYSPEFTLTRLCA